MYKYDGPRTTEDFVRFADRIADTSVHVLQFNQADITELQRRDDVNVFVFCTPDGQPTEQVRWIAQRGLTYLRSYYGTHPSKSEFCGDRNTAFLINDIGTQEVQPEKGTFEECIGDELDSVRLWSVMEWVMKHKSLTVDRVDQSTFHHLSRANAPLLLMYVSQEGTWEDVRPLLTVLRAVAKTPVSERFTLGWLDGVAFAEWVQELVPAEGLPNIIVYSVDDEGTYSDEDVRAAVLEAVEAGGDPDKRLEESVSAMLLAINNGELEPEYRGLARYVLGPAQRYAPFLLPMLKELRSSAQNDFLFFSVVIAMVVLTVCERRRRRRRRRKKKRINQSCCSWQTHTTLVGAQQNASLHAADGVHELSAASLWPRGGATSPEGDARSSASGYGSEKGRGGTAGCCRTAAEGGMARAVVCVWNPDTLILTLPSSLLQKTD